MGDAEREIRDAVQRISGRVGKKGYADLRSAVAAAVRNLPEVSMQAVCEEVGQGRREGEAVSQSLSRITLDIWERGDRAELERIMGHRLCEKPSPKDLVTGLAEYVQRETRRVEYHVLEADVPRRYGIWGRETAPGGASAAAAPFTESYAEAARLAERFNREQLDLSAFRALFLGGVFRT